MMQDTFTSVSPLSNLANKVMISNAPTFIKTISCWRSCPGIGSWSPIRMVTLGCKSPKLKHVVCYRRQVLMILKVKEGHLNLSFSLNVDVYMVFASSENMRCFGCGLLLPREMWSSIGSAGCGCCCWWGSAVFCCSCGRSGPASAMALSDSAVVVGPAASVLTVAPTEGAPPPPLHSSLALSRGGPGAWCPWRTALWKSVPKHWFIHQWMKLKLL